MATKVFSKIHGCGNSFVLIDDRARRIGAVPALARRLCSQYFGIGADGLILIRNSRSADLRMDYYNSDGSRAEMCGNGLRCMAKFVYDRRIRRGLKLRIETPAGVVTTSIVKSAGKRKSIVKVDMGEPCFSSRDFKLTSPPGAEFTIGRRRFTFVSMGNPHAVTFVRSLTLDLAQEGRRIENMRRAFPNKTNVEFVQMRNRRNMRLRVWERGCGITMACGSGACAAVVAAHLRRLVGKGPVRVELDGGVLEIEWHRPSNHIFMIGPAETVCEGKAAL